MRMGLVGPSSKNSICDLYNSPVTSAAASSSGAVAVGNSNGDIEMLRFARTHQRDALRILVRHGDQEREGAAYDQVAEDVLARAAERGGTVISMRNDWTRVFPDG